MDPITLVLVVLVIVLIFAIITRRLDRLTGTVAVLLILLNMFLWGKVPH